VDQKTAARLAAEARARAARLRAQRARTAKAWATTRRRAARERADAVVQAESAALVGRRRPLVAQTPFETESKVARVMPFALMFILAALLFFSLAAIPARVVPWYWAVQALDHRREELAFLGIAALLAIAALFLAG
jgi:hypothetical protein